MFRSLRLALVALALLGLQGGVLAGEAVRQFAQELLEHEARQMRQPSVALKYSDGKDGAALRQLMSPERGGVVIQDWLASQVRGETDTPDIPTLIKPLINRYQKAFAAMPRDFGEEYLDSFNWVALVMRGGRDLVRMPATPAPPGPAIDPATLQQLRSASDRLMNTVMGMAQGVLRRHIADGMFGPELMAKAIAVLVKLTPDAAAIPLDPPTPAAPKPEQNNLRIVQTGKQVYASSCAACHTPGIAGAPKLGDSGAWAPRLRSGLDAMVRNTLRGVNNMPGQGGGDFHDVEIARAVVYLANSAGAEYAAPAMPGGQAMISVQRAPILGTPARAAQQGPYVVMNFDEKLNYGERLFETTCVACHGRDARGSGPIPSLVNASSLASANSTVNAIVYGNAERKPPRGMPPWAHLTDDEVAAVANFMRYKFSGDLVEFVDPQEVKAMRR